MATVERLIIEVTEKGGKKVTRVIRETGVEAKKADKGVKLLTKGLVGLTAGFGALQAARAGVNVIREFGQEISTVGAVLNATGSDFDAIREKARELGATTRFTGAQAAEGMTLLARAGFDVEETIGAAGQVLQLAQAGALDLATAADITASTLRGFRLEVEDSARVVDILAKASASANTDVLQLGEAIKFVAPVAAGLGVELETTTAAIAALSDAGLQGSLAGTGLRRVMAELEAPTSKNQKRFAELGVAVEDIKVSSVGLTSALQTLKDAGIETGDALTIFGQRGGPAFEVLVNAIPKVTELEEELQRASGTAARMAEQMDDNLNGAFLRMKSASEDLAIAIGDTGLTQVLIDDINAIAAAIRGLSGAVKTLSEVQPTLIIGARQDILLKAQALKAAITGDFEDAKKFLQIAKDFREAGSAFDTGARLAPRILPEGAGPADKEGEEAVKKKLNEVVKEQSDFVKAVIERAQREQQKAQLDAFFAKPEVELIKIDKEDVIQPILELEEAIEGVDDATKGLGRTQLQVFDILHDSYKQLGDTLIDAATGADDAFKDFFANLLRQLANLAFQELILSIPGARGSAFFGRQHGGPFQAGDQMVVGERRAEIVTFGQGGRVDPIPQAASSNVTVVNVTDPNMVNNFIDSGQADRTIINRLAANPDLVSAALPRKQ